MTGTAAGLLPVAEIDGRRIGGGWPFSNQDIDASAAGGAVPQATTAVHLCAPPQPAPAGGWLFSEQHRHDVSAAGGAAPGDGRRASSSSRADRAGGAEALAAIPGPVTARLQAAYAALKEQEAGRGRVRLCEAPRA